MLRILVVEDNPLVAKFYRLALERAGGFQVTFSEDVDGILAQVASSAFDALLLDVSLRNCRYQDRPIDGLELAQLIRQVPEGKSLPILLATAHAMEGDRQRLLAASGANAYLEKPIYDPNILITKIREMVKL
ncbi:MAG TPA: response regulator [Terriglobia bacterium]|nr:response regulator [Terriglobia bacterium]